MEVFKLVQIKEVKAKYSFLEQYEGFDLYQDWNDDDFFAVCEGDISFNGNLNLDIYNDAGKKQLLLFIRL